MKDEVRLELAECYIRRKDYQEALDTLQGCEPPKELLPKLLTLEAESFLALGKNDQARDRLARSRKIDADFPSALRLEAKLLLQAARGGCQWGKPIGLRRLHPVCQTKPGAKPCSTFTPASPG